MSITDRADPVFFSLASNLEGGVPQLLDLLFGFLDRKTDFFTHPDKAKDIVLGAFDKYAKIAEKVSEFHLFYSVFRVLRRRKRSVKLMRSV